MRFAIGDQPTVTPILCRRQDRRIAHSPDPSQLTEWSPHAPTGRSSSRRAVNARAGGSGLLMTGIVTVSAATGAK